MSNSHSVTKSERDGPCGDATGNNSPKGKKFRLPPPLRPSPRDAHRADYALSWSYRAGSPTERDLQPGSLNKNSSGASAQLGGDFPSWKPAGHTLEFGDIVLTPWPSKSGICDTPFSIFSKSGILGKVPGNDSSIHAWSCPSRRAAGGLRWKQKRPRLNGPDKFDGGKPSSNCLIF